MRLSTKILALGCAAMAGPLLALTAQQIAGAGSESEMANGDGAFVGTGPGFVTHSCWENPDGSGTCEVFGEGGGGTGGVSGGGGTGGGTGCPTGISPHVMLGCTTEGGGGGGIPPPPLRCSFGNGDVTVTFDGRTLRIYGKYRLTGDGASTAGPYIDGIEDRWTQDFGDIAVETHLTPDPNGFVIRVFGTDYTEPYSINYGGAYMDVEPGTSHFRVNVGTIFGFSGTDLQTRFNIAAHEFGHFFLPNLPQTSVDPSIMSNGYIGRVLPSDLRDIVKKCRDVQ